MKRKWQIEKHAKDKAEYCKQVEHIVIFKRPDLTGKFTAMNLWDTVYYGYFCNWTVETTAQKIIDLQ